VLLLRRMDGRGGLLLDGHAALLHRVDLSLQGCDRRALCLDVLLGSGKCYSEVGNDLPYETTNALLLLTVAIP
jgi:hypothetical protein